MPVTSQIPAVKLIEVTFAAVVLVIEPFAVLLICSPINPAGGAVFVLFPLSWRPVERMVKLVVSTPI